MPLEDRIVIYQGSDAPDDPSTVLIIDYLNLSTFLCSGDEQVELPRDDLPKAIAALQEAQKRLA